MCKFQISRSTLIDDFDKAIREAGYPESSITRKKRHLPFLVKLMEEESFEQFTSEVGWRLECSLRQKESSGEISRTRAKLTSVIIRQLNCLACGRPISSSKESISINIFPDAYKGLGEEFLECKRESLRWSESTERRYRRSLVKFTNKLCIGRIQPGMIKYENVISFLGSSMNLEERIVKPVRSFLEFLYVKGVLSMPVHNQITVAKTKRKEKIPSVYTPEEIAKIESSVSRGTAKGKRDYAIILLASRLGMRSSDIRTLTFKDLDWDGCRITLIQYKTKRPIVLPLLNDVGNAIIDYILHGRPQSDSKCIFVRHDAPFTELSGPGISSIVSDAVHSANISGKKRHKGPHSLRHSLATSMLDNGSPLPIISSSLGHESVESTKYYLGVSVKLLMKCSHEVPEVPDEFYEQKGGVLYV